MRKQHISQQTGKPSLASSTKKNILFVGEGVTMAHVVRPLALAQSIDKKIYNVFFACDSRFEHLLHNSNLVHVPMETIPSSVFQKRISKGQPVYTYKELASYVADDQKIIDMVQPDVIVFDFRITMPISAANNNIEHINLCNAQWSPYNKSPLPIPDITATRIMGYPLAKHILPTIAPILFKQHYKAYNKLRKQHGLKPVDSIYSMYTLGSTTLYMDGADMYSMEPLPANHHFIGPVHWSSSADLPAWFDDLAKDKKTILISPGSSGSIEAIQKAIDYLKDQNYNLVVATANRFELQEHKNLYAVTYLPMDKMMKRSDLIICNGGSTMAYQAMEMGKPILALPYSLDQYYVAQALKNKNKGTYLRRTEITKKKMVEATSQLLWETSAPTEQQNSVSGIEKFNVILESITKKELNNLSI